MFFSDGYNIKIPRGDTADIPFTLLKHGRLEPYILSEDQSLRLDVRLRLSDDTVISKTAESAVQSQSGTVVFSFSGEDTDILRNCYEYTLALVGGDGRKDTLIGSPEPAKFTIGLDCSEENPSGAERGITVIVENTDIDLAECEISGTAAGTAPELIGAAEAAFMGLVIYGRTVDGESPGDRGSVTVLSANGARSSSVTLTAGLPLRGIPAEENATYTDENGDKWLADTADFSSGTITKRVEYNAEEGSLAALDVPVVIQMSEAEKAAFRAFRTFGAGTVITDTGGAFMRVDYIRGTGNGRAVSDVRDSLSARDDEIARRTDAVAHAVAGKQDRITVSRLLTLTVSGWSGNTQTVAYLHDTYKRNVIDVTETDVLAWGNAGIYAASETSENITFRCANTPSGVLTFRVTSMEVSAE